MRTKPPAISDPDLHTTKICQTLSVSQFSYEIAGKKKDSPNPGHPLLHSTMDSEKLGSSLGSPQLVVTRVGKTKKHNRKTYGRSPPHLDCNHLLDVSCLSRRTVCCSPADCPDVLDVHGTHPRRPVVPRTWNRGTLTTKVLFVFLVYGILFFFFFFIYRYRPKGVLGKGVGNNKNASGMRQECVRNASKMRQNVSCFIGKEELSGTQSTVARVRLQPVFNFCSHSSRCLAVLV